MTVTTAVEERRLELRKGLAQAEEWLVRAGAVSGTTDEWRREVKRTPRRCGGC